MNVKDVEVIDCDDKEDKEEDWLPPPPKNLDNGSKTIEEDSTLKALRYTNNGNYNFLYIFCIFFH